MRGMKCQKRIAVAAERSSAYGRSFIRGVAEVAEQHPEWNLALIDPQHVASMAASKFDGWICRVADGRTTKALVQCKSPVVDCLCAVAEPKFATVKTDAEAIGRLAADHLLKRHFTNFAFCGYRRVSFSDRRRNTFASYLEALGMKPEIYRPPLRRQNKFGRDFLLGGLLLVVFGIEPTALALDFLAAQFLLLCLDPFLFSFEKGPGLHELGRVLVYLLLDG